ncbi:hypothetical protein [Clostridium sp. UBA4548]|uniref:hypothetical protein n=1 Tax=Clostridium sp. UBA4548 TaxID=1946361 RepID=UPI0025BDEA75|nr:hypothetical protein [Clostridium sp. UBA4548]
MKSGNKEAYESLPEGYLEQRRKSDLRYVWSLYVLGIFLILNSYDIISVEKTTFFIGLVVMIGINTFAMMMSVKSKRIYNNIPIPKYGEVKVFTKIEVFLYGLPIIVMVPFIVQRFHVLLLVYLICFVNAYRTAGSINRPKDAFDKARERHY